MEYPRIVKNLKSQGYFSLPEYTPEQSSLVANTMNAWEKFVRQTSDHKRLHVFEGPQGNGYEYRGPENPTDKEHKETFHLSLPYVAPAGSSGLDKSLIGVGKQLLQAIHPIVSQIGEVLTEASGVAGLAALMTERPENWVLRMLHYPPDPRPILAESHVDKGVTVHLAATAPGLQIFWNNEWIDVPEAENSAYGYAGLLGQYHTRCAVKGLEHQVVTCPKTRQQGRYSLVVFLDFGDMRYDKKNVRSYPGPVSGWRTLRYAIQGIQEILRSGKGCGYELKCFSYEKHEHAQAKPARVFLLPVLTNPAESIGWKKTRAYDRPEYPRALRNAPLDQFRQTMPVGPYAGDGGSLL